MVRVGNVASDVIDVVERKSAVCARVTPPGGDERVLPRLLARKMMICSMRHDATSPAKTLYRSGVESKSGHVMLRFRDMINAAAHVEMTLRHADTHCRRTRRQQI